MKKYSPMAKYIDPNRSSEQTIWTYDSYTKLSKALEVIRIWNTIFWVRKAWIEETDTDDRLYKKIISVDYSPIEEKEDADSD